MHINIGDIEIKVLKVKVWDKQLIMMEYASRAYYCLTLSVQK